MDPQLLMEGERAMEGEIVTLAGRTTIYADNMSMNGHPITDAGIARRGWSPPVADNEQPGRSREMVSDMARQVTLRPHHRQVGHVRRLV